jgi:hypothetical protein
MREPRSEGRDHRIAGAFVMAFVLCSAAPGAPNSDILSRTAIKLEVK